MAFGTIYKNEKYTSSASSCEIDQKYFFDQHSALQAACDTSIARVTGCVYPREGYRSVTSVLNARVNRTKTFSLVLPTETV